MPLGWMAVVGCGHLGAPLPGDRIVTVDLYRQWSQTEMYTKLTMLTGTPVMALQVQAGPSKVASSAQNV